MERGLGGGGREGVVLGSMPPLFLSHGVALLGVQGACGRHSESQDTAEKLGKGRGGARSDWLRRCMCGEHTGGRDIERLSRAQSMAGVRVTTAPSCLEV